MFNDSVFSNQWDNIDFDANMENFKNLISGSDYLSMAITPSGIIHNEYTIQETAYNACNLSPGSEKAMVNFLLGHWRNGTGPDNYIFSTNSEVSEFMRGAQVVQEAMILWWETFGNIDKNHDSFDDVFHKKMEYDLGNQAINIVNGTTISMENFCGSVDVVIRNIDENTVKVTIYNVTSITSGDISKHFSGKYPSSKVRKNSYTRPYSNTLQVFQLTFTRDEIKLLYENK